MKKILVTGGAGYVGSKLIQSLLNKNYEVTCVDTMWFGNYLSGHPNLLIKKGDFRDHLSDLKGNDVLIHLANIANDPAVDLDPVLSWEVNVLGSRMISDAAIKYNVSQIIYASSGSVYGIQASPNVTEDLDLKPISVYNKTKMCAEAIFLSSSLKGISTHILRPATVCGLSPRMRLDVSVNMLTFQAMDKGVITVYGGDQTRPNIHIEDMVEVYEFFLENPSLKSSCYNAGFENISINDLATLIGEKTGAKILRTDSNDPRSYRQDSSKLIRLGFQPKKTVSNAIDEIILAYKDGQLKNNLEWYTVKMMKKQKG